MITAPVSASEVGLYVHWPYCERKCPYCDFNVHAVPHDDAAYADAILIELEARAPRYPAPFSTLYFGGGTPSEWAPEQVARVIAGARARGLVARAEITLEANPGTLASARLEAYARAGVTRLSIGAQSFRAAELELLGRNHDGPATERLATAARALGLAYSLDLIYALPGQSARELDASVDRALQLQPSHLSAYTLTIEPDTTLGKRTALGLFTPLEDDRQADLIEHLSRRLQAAGYQRYEISSYAPPGNEARHNSLYWVGAPYLGLGAGAHSYLPAPGLAWAERRENRRAPADYLAVTLDGTHAPRFEERLDRAQAVGDRLLVGLRTRWGLDAAALAAEAELAGRLEPLLLPALRELERQGLLHLEGLAARPTERGFLFADLIAKKLMSAAASC